MGPLLTPGTEKSEVVAASVTPESGLQKRLQNLCAHSDVHTQVVRMVNSMLCVFHNFYLFF